MAVKKDASARETAQQPRCRHCGRPLRRAESVSRGCGPGCWRKKIAGLMARQTALPL